MGRLQRELTLWWEAFCFNSPGGIGAKLRKRLFLKKTSSLATSINIGPNTYVHGWENLRFNDGLSIGRGCIFETATGKLTLGRNVSLNSGVVLASDDGSIEIGNDVLIGMNTVFRAAGHRFSQSPEVPINQQGHIPGTIVIGNDVWIGANVTVLPGAHIHDHCVIGAGAVVKGTLPEGSVAVGVPAKVVKSIKSI